MLPQIATHLLRIESTWNGLAIPGSEVASVAIRYNDTDVIIDIDSPYWHDAPPKQPAGTTPMLWEHEVVELFLLGSNDRYLEIEMGPHGHYLALELFGRRNVVRQGMTFSYHAQINNNRWTGHARFPLGWLPPGLSHLNAYAIHGLGDKRRHLAWKATMGEAPDFHCLDRFGAVAANSDI